MLPSRLVAELAEKQQAFSYRQRVICQPNGKYIQIDNKQYLNYSGNDYLGIAGSKELTQAWQQAAEHSKFGNISGSTGSALINGYHAAHADLEAKMADWLGFEQVLLFSTGFSANSSVLKTLMSETNGLILQDKLNHASLIDGGLAANAKSVRFAHNDMAHLAKKLKQTKAPEKLIVSEGVFSMDGDQAPIKSLTELSQSYATSLMLDDAHGIGVFGQQGKGSLAKQNIHPKEVDIYMATLGKAIGTSGAVIAGSRTLIDYLVNFSRSYIYSTSLSPVHAELTSYAIDMVTHQQWRRDKLADNIAFFRQKITESGLAASPSHSAIQPVLIGENETTLSVAKQLAEVGIWLTAIRPPTVPKGTARLRITLSALHDKTDIEYLIQHLVKALKMVA